MTLSKTHYRYFLTTLALCLTLLAYGSTAWAEQGFEAALADNERVYLSGEQVVPLKLRQRPEGRIHDGPIIVNRCPLRTVLTPFDMPIYDEQGLFVVGYETVWFCLPDDLEPEG